MGRQSAGLLLWRRAAEIDVLLAHPGGPFYARKDDGAWTLPKGEAEPGEDLLAAARREFAEELGLPVPPGEPVPLGEVRYSSGKVVTAWAVQGDLDPAAVVPGTCEITVGGRALTIPEVDRVAWFPLPTARVKLLPAQRPFLDRLAAVTGVPG
jgi:predicted NUDIX family NTP pyrophosphohydrolase